jgi:hypothetical protein
VYVDGRHLSFSLFSAMGGMVGKLGGRGPGGQELESRSRHGQAAVLTRQEGARLDNLGGKEQARQPNERTGGAVLDNPVRKEQARQPDEITGGAVLDNPGRPLNGREEQCSTTLVGWEELCSTTRDFWQQRLIHGRFTHKAVSAVV